MMADDTKTGDESVISRIRRPRSLTSIVADQIRELIVSGKLALGEQLSENTLSEQLGVSRTPVREAFLRLEAERLVVVRPQRGTFVFQFDVTELREICELREVLETGALRIALGRDRRKLIGALADRLDEAEAGVAQGPAAYQAHDTAFHEILVRASDNRELIEAYMRVSGRIRAVRYRLTTTQAQIGNSHARHREIVDCITAGDDALALRHLGYHVYSSYNFFIGQIDSAAPKTATTNA